MNKRGFQLAISTIILLILGILVLISLILIVTGQFEAFLDVIRNYGGSDIDNLNKLCQSQCDLKQEYDFCCGEKVIKKEEITCLDDRLSVDCGIDCAGVC